MRALITGNLGYIGAEATQLFAAAGHQVHGIDAEFYKGYHLYAWEPPVDKQIRKDIRHIEAEDFDNIDVVVHLAALSNDPLGELQRDLTFDINYKASVRVAELAKAQGVSRFVMASTSSLYGVAEDKVHEESPLNPLTAYAESKMLAEQEIMQMRVE
jgi:nucleoside-diphosphate-sugar epimerase